MGWQDEWRLVAALTAVTLTAAACGSGGGTSAGDGDEPSGRLVVFAAASLADAFDEVGAAFSDLHPRVEVVFNFAGSQTLAGQISEGAPADVFASADTTQMSAVGSSGGIAGDPTTFAGNRLAIVVEPGNPLGITGLDDLAGPDVVLVLPAEAVPAGRYARQALEAAGVAVSPASLEHDVRAARSKVALGEADAAIVFASDVQAAGGRVTGVDIPPESNVIAIYPIAAVADAPNPAAADAFVAFVLGDDGQSILRGHGFTTP